MTSDVFVWARPWLRTWSWLPPVLRPRRVYIGPTGEVLRLDDRLHLDRVVQGGRPHGGIAEGPTAEG